MRLLSDVGRQQRHHPRHSQGRIPGPGPPRYRLTLVRDFQGVSTLRSVARNVKPLAPLVTVLRVLQQHNSFTNDSGSRQITGGTIVANSLDSRNARIKTYVAALFEQLPAPGKNDGFASAAFTRTRKLSTLARGCGSSTVHAELLRDLEQALEAAKIYTHRPVSSPALKRNDVVQLSRLRFAPDELFFENEQLLQDFLFAGIGQFGPLRDLERAEQEFALPSGRSIDILCRERRKDGRGDLVVVELKKAKKARGVVTQIVGYLQELSAHPLAKGRKVRGIIVSGRGDDVEAGTLASERRFRIEWYHYKVSLEKGQTSSPAA